MSRSLPVGKPEKVADRALQLRGEGSKGSTLKGVGNVTEDYAVFHAVRKVLGGGFELEIDPNGAYDAPSAVNSLRKLEQLDLYAVEQPTAGNDLRALSEVKSKVGASVIADESVFTTRDLREIIKLDAADTICLKPFKDGGILASRKLPHAVECSGLRVSTGSMHPFGIGIVALHIFAAGISDLMTAGYGSPSERFADDVLDESSYRFENGTVKYTMTASV